MLVGSCKDGAITNKMKFWKSVLDRSAAMSEEDAERRLADQRTALEEENERRLAELRVAVESSSP